MPFKKKNPFELPAKKPIEAPALDTETPPADAEAPPSPLEVPLPQEDLTPEELAIIAADPSADDDVIPPWDK